MKKDYFASPWRKVAENWSKYYTPPGRPSSQDKKHYENFIKKATNGLPARALVLGATPEIRNLLHKFPIEVTVLDNSIEMIVAMNQSVPEWQKDILVKDTWTNKILADNYFDLVLGDLTWANVPQEKWKTFHENIKRVLKPHGFYIHRVTVIPEDWKVQPTNQTLLFYGNLPFISRRHFELFFHLLTDTFDKKSRTISLDRVRKNLRPFWRNGKLISKNKIPGTARLIRKMLAFWGDVSKTWQTDKPHVLLELIKPYFSIEEVVVSKDYLCADTSPFWFCQSKKK